MDPVLLVAGATGLLTGLGLAESWRHERNLKQIPIRVHVNGTRGKSGVTRLIAAGLRAAGICTFAKTTGTLARMILPDGSERPVVRSGRANVIEQVGIVRLAASHNVEALVVECMALQPQLQALSELKMIRSTHGVITNARPDHLDVMGPTDVDVARALSGTTPHAGRLYTCEQKHRKILALAAADRETDLICIRDEDVDRVTSEELRGFPYIEHGENVALALRVCADLGVARDTALRGMWNATPDPGVLSTHVVRLRGQELVFVNGFAANDPVSTEQNWHLAVNRFADVQCRTAVFNCRADRPDRSEQLAQACVRWQPADHYLLIGTGTQVFARRARACGLCGTRISSAEQLRPAEIFDRLLQFSPGSALVMGMGNIGGPGLEIMDYVKACGPAHAGASDSESQYGPMTKECQLWIPSASL